MNDEPTFESYPYEEPSPWFTVPRDLARNSELSINARWLLMYLLSHTTNFKISIPWVRKTQKISKNKMYSMIDECIEQGYIKRETFLVKGMKRYKYFVSYSGKFKKSLLCPQNQDTENEDTKIYQPPEELEPSSSLSDSLVVPPQKSKGFQKEVKEAKAILPPQKSLYEGKFENKIKITEEQKAEVIKNLNCSEEVFESTVERLYDYSLNKPQEFKKYKRHDITVKNWIQRDTKKTSFHKPADPNQTQLNPAQMSNWKLNEKMVTELKSQMPDKSNGLYFFYKHFILKDKNNPQFDLCAYIDHKDFCRLLGNNVKLRITPFEVS